MNRIWIGIAANCISKLGVAIGTYTRYLGKSDELRKEMMYKVSFPFFGVIAKFMGISKTRLTLVKSSKLRLINTITAGVYCPPILS